MPPKSSSERVRVHVISLRQPSAFALLNGIQDCINLSKPARVNFPAWFAVRAYASKPSLRQLRSLNKTGRLKISKLPEDRGAYDVSGSILGVVRVTECSLKPQSEPRWHTPGKHACVIGRVIRFTGEKIAFPFDVRRSPLVSLDRSQKYQGVAKKILNRISKHEKETREKTKRKDDRKRGQTVSSEGGAKKTTQPPASVPPVHGDTSSCSSANEEGKASLEESHSYALAARTLSSVVEKKMNMVVFLHPCRVRVERKRGGIEVTVTTFPETEAELDRVEKERPLKVNVRAFLKSLRLLSTERLVFVPTCPYLSL
jgi:hypothetical protein